MTIWAARISNKNDSQKMTAVEENHQEIYLKVAKQKSREYREKSPLVKCECGSYVKEYYIQKHRTMARHFRNIELKKILSSATGEAKTQQEASS